MLKSMTGFGRYELDEDDTRVTVEVRSVNNRFLDVNLYLPHSLSVFEGELKKMVESVFSRGRIEVRIEIETEEAEGHLAEPDLPFAKSLKAALEKVAAELDLPRAQEITLENLCSIPGVVKPRNQKTSLQESDLALVKKTLEEALSGLQSMREQEGQALETDLELKLDTVSDIVSRTEALAPAMKDVFLKRLKERLALCTPEMNLPEDRLYQEAVLLAERSDITEELVRLNSHVSQFRQTVKSGEPAGKKLDFLAQEMNREGNTIASKARSTDISTLALEIRTEVEKIREQVRNIE